MGGCAGMLFLMTAGAATWLTIANQPEPRITATRISRQAMTVALPQATYTNTPSPTMTATATPSPTDTPTPTPTLTATPTETPTPIPPSATPLPTATPTPIPIPPTPTDTPEPTDTPAPVYEFTILESQTYPTNHLNFDVYVAVTDGGNNPLGGYRVIGQHSGGMGLDSQPTADRWTQNSGAMHYKAGNVKYEVMNSPTGSWTLQLVNGANQPVAPPIELGFDAQNPSWHFVLYRKVN